jgi:heme oxygenase
LKNAANGDSSQVETGQRAVELASTELTRLLERLETMRRADASTDDLARVAGEIRALTQDLRRMTAEREATA